jgi:hypothetical protein
MSHYGTAPTDRVNDCGRVGCRMHPSRCFIPQSLRRKKSGRKPVPQLRIQVFPRFSPPAFPSICSILWADMGSSQWCHGRDNVWVFADDEDGVGLASYRSERAPVEAGSAETLAMPAMNRSVLQTLGDFQISLVNKHMPLLEEWLRVAVKVGAPSSNPVALQPTHTTSNYRL